VCPSANALAAFGETMSGRPHCTRPAEIRRAYGFTIVELLVTVVIAAMLLAYALPNFREIAVRNNVTEINNQIVQALNLARSEAVRRGAQVEVTSVGNVAKWNSGWKVIPDANFNGTFDSTEISVNSGASIPTGYGVCAKSSGSSGVCGDGTVVFDPTGALKCSTKLDINVNRPDSNTTLSKHITISATGIITSQTGLSGSLAATTPTCT